MGRGLRLGSCLAWGLPEFSAFILVLCFVFLILPAPSRSPSPPRLSSPSPSTQRPQALPSPAAQPADNPPGVGPPGTPQRHPDWVFAPIPALYVSLCLFLANPGVRSPTLTILPEDPRGPGVQIEGTARGAAPPGLGEAAETQPCFPNTDPSSCLCDKGNFWSKEGSNPSPRGSYSPNTYESRRGPLL